MSGNTRCISKLKPAKSNGISAPGFCGSSTTPRFACAAHRKVVVTNSTPAAQKKCRRKSDLVGGMAANCQNRVGEPPPCKITDGRSKIWCQRVESNHCRQVFRCYPACPYRYISLPITTPHTPC